MKREAILARIANLLKLHVGGDDEAPLRSYQLYMGIVTIVAHLYGASSAQMQALRDEKERLMGIKANEFRKHEIFIRELHGLLKTIVAEVEAGLVHAIETSCEGSVLQITNNLNVPVIRKDQLILAANTMNERQRDFKEWHRAVRMSCRSYGICRITTIAR